MLYPYESLFLEMGLGEAIVAQELSGCAFDPSGSFALELWLKLSDCNTTKVILSKEGVFSLQVAKNKVEFFVQGYRTVTAQDAILPDNWVHVAVSCYHGNVRVFLDGGITAEEMVTGTGVSNANPVKIGADFFGALRFVRVYQSALTAQEIVAAMYQYAVTAKMSAFYDFTRNPPKELKSERTLTLPQTCQIVCAMPGAQYESGGWIDISQSDAVNPSGKRSTPYTVQLWVRLAPDAQAQVCTLFYNANPDGMAGMALALVKNGDSYRLQAIHGTLDNTTQPLDATVTVRKGQWYNFAVTWQNKTLTLYLDGDQVAQRADFEALNKALIPKVTLLGAGVSHYSPNGENLLEGCISRVDVWDKALTSAELRSYAVHEPDWNADGLTGTWSFFTQYVANRVDSLPVTRINDLQIREVRIAAVTGQSEQRPPLMKNEPDPLSPAQLADCRARAFADVCDGISDSPMGLRANTCRVEDTVFFVLHGETNSYTACSIPAELLEGDPMLEWQIGLILILLGAVVSLFFSMNLTYNTHLGTYLRLEVVGNPQFVIQLANMRDTAGAVTFILGFFKQLFAENKLWQLLSLCVQIGFWALVSGLTKLAAKVFGGPAAWMVWLTLTGGAILYHLSKKPRELPELAITSILFSHRRANSVCSINIRKNEGVMWPRPEWQPSTETQRVPAVYRIARFAANTDLLQITAEFQCSDLTVHTVSIRGIAVGPNAALTGDTNNVAVTLTNGVSGPIYFTLANHTLNTGGIRRADTSWKWQQLKAGAWADIKTTNHRLYTILDSVRLPWEFSADWRECLWTDCLDFAFGWVAGRTTPQAVAGALTDGLYASARIRYDGTAHYATIIDVGGIACKAFQTTEFLKDWSELPAQILRFNCEDCADFIVTFANLYGCDLWQVGLGSNFEVPNILFIGETDWRQPVNDQQIKGVFNYHIVACESLNRGANYDATQYKVYDPCLQYRNADGTATLAKNVQLSQYAAMPAVFPIVPAPLHGFYREDLLPNTQEGIGHCAIVHVKRVYLG